MEAKSFVKLLRKVIREEVRSALKETLNEQKVDHKKVINHGMDLHNIVAKDKPKTKKRSFTKNSILNDLLNETAQTADFGSMREGPLVMQDSYPSTDFKSEMAESIGTSMQPQSLATTDTNGKPVDMSNENVAKTVGIMTKDYSALMKALDKKDKQKGKK